MPKKPDSSHASGLLTADGEYAIATVTVDCVSDLPPILQEASGRGLRLVSVVRCNECCYVLFLQRDPVAKLRDALETAAERLSVAEQNMLELGQPTLAEFYQRWAAEARAAL
jgi:hypothetical protein